MNLTDRLPAGIRPGHVVITLLAVVMMLVAALYFRQPVVTEGAVRDTGGTTRVLVEPVERSDVDRRIDAVGRVRPWRQVSLAPEVTGRIESVEVRLGDRVAADQVLLTVDESSYEEAVRQRQAELRRAEARVEETGSLADRLEPLHERGIVSGREYDAALARHQAARAELDAAIAALDRAVRQLSDCRLRAPFAGTITARRVDPGDLAGPDRVVLMLADLRTVAVEVGLTESEVGRVRRGQEVSVLKRGVVPRSLSGVVDGVADSDDPETGTYEVRVEVDNPDGPSRLLAGMVVRVVIPWDRLEGVLTVPAEAVAYRDGRPHAFVVEDGRARRVALRLLARTDGRHAVVEAMSPSGPAADRSGEPFLRAGDRVVVVGHSRLEDGDEVEVASR